MTEIPDNIQIPSVDTAPKDKIPYYDFLAENEKRITIRELLEHWGYTTRGVNINNKINAQMEAIGFHTNPPIDIEPLDSYIYIHRIDNNSSDSSNQKSITTELTDSNHLLTMRVIPSATLNQQKNAGLTTANPEEPIESALTKMLQNDFSQLPVTTKEDPNTILGAFSWESYAHATMSGRKPKIVKDAICNPRVVELRTDLFQSTKDIAQHGVVYITDQGKLSGLVTSSDLTAQFEQLAVPFLAIGRAEQELKRVAKLLIGENQTTKKGDEIPVESMVLGQLKNYYSNNWDLLKWKIDKDLFLSWFDTVRELRNKIAHYDTTDETIEHEIDQANRLTIWLQHFKNTHDSKEDSPQINSEYLHN